jgi:hypothetical protein
MARRCQAQGNKAWIGIYCMGQTSCVTVSGLPVTLTGYINEGNLPANHRNCLVAGQTPNETDNFKCCAPPKREYICQIGVTSTQDVCVVVRVQTHSLPLTAFLLALAYLLLIAFRSALH